jgi:hypothetical protein
VLFKEMEVLVNETSFYYYQLILPKCYVNRLLDVYPVFPRVGSISITFKRGYTSSHGSGH